MSNALLLWECWYRWQGSPPQSPVDQINNILDSQRRFQSMLKDNDVFYSRTDLRMFIDKCRADALSKLLSAFSDIDETSGHDYILHAAAKLMVSPLNTEQLIKDYTELVQHKHPDDTNGSLPLHLAAAAVGGEDHVDRVKVFLNSYPDAIKHVNEHQLLPMQIALIHGADYDVMKLLTDAYQPALEYPFLPSSETIPTEFLPMIGMLPFHVACCRNYSLNVIFTLLVESPDTLRSANCSNELTTSLEKLTM